MPATISGFDSSAPFFSSAVSSQSWFAANKYILGALLVVAIVIGLIVLIR
jgi:nitrate reductase gamma subunit